MIQPYYQGFTTLQQEVVDKKLAVIGEIPEWLQGNFICNGPAKFEMGNKTVNHWFDGYAMLKGFKINGNQIFYTNSFLKTDAYRQGIKAQKICLPEFATNPSGGAPKNWLHFFNPLLTDNTSVNVTEINGKHIALTETCRYVQYDMHTLNMLDYFYYKDNIQGHITCAHPQYDESKQAFYNFVIQISKNSHYHFYKLSKNSESRELIASIPVKKPAYIHSFAMTQNYLVLIEPPFRFSPLKFLFSKKPFIENYQWNEAAGTEITVIDKNNGAQVFRGTTESFYAFHQINAFEKNKNIEIDLAVYRDTKIIQALYLKNLNDYENFPIAKPEHLHISLTDQKISRKSLSDCAIELPRINDANYNTRQYRYVYGVSIHKAGNFLNQLIKIDVTQDKPLIWSNPGCYPGEPVFVPQNKTNTEDEGVILSIVLDSHERKSFFLILDAASLQELARCPLPHCVPFGFHGQFYRAGTETDPSI